MSLLVTAVADGAALDTVTLDQGVLTYATGAARDVFEGLRVLNASLSDADLYRLLTGWTNGYIEVAEEGPVVAAADRNYVRDNDGQFSEVAGGGAPNAADKLKLGGKAPAGRRGLPVLTGERYLDLYGDVLDEDEVEVELENWDRPVKLRMFKIGDVHLVFDHEDGSRSVLPELDDGDAMRELADDLRKVAGEDPDSHGEPDDNDFVEQWTSEHHELVTSLNADGELHLADEHGNGFDLSLVDAEALADALDDMANTWDEKFLAASGPTTAAAAPFGTALDDRNLRQHWVHGEGAAIIQWKLDGAFDRCVEQLDGYSDGGTKFDPEGLCAEYYREANGRWPGSKKDTGIVTAAARRYKRDGEGRFAKTAGQAVAELDDLMAKLASLSASFEGDEYDEDSPVDVENAMDALKQLRERQAAKAVRRSANMDTGNHGEIEVLIHGDGDVGVGFTDNSDDFYSSPETMRELAAGIDELRKKIPPIPTTGRAGEFTTSGGEFKVTAWNTGDLEVVPNVDVEPDEDDEDEPAEPDSLWLSSDEAATFADIVEELAERSMEDPPEGLEPGPVTAAAYSDMSAPGSCGACLEPLPGELWHAVAHIEGVSTGQRVWLPGALSWREPPFAFHWEIESGAHGGTPRVVQVGMVTRILRDGDMIHTWGNIDTGDPLGAEYARKLAQGFVRGVSMGPGNERIVYDQVWPQGLTAEQMVSAQPEQWVFTDYRIGELTGVSVPAQEGAFLEPTLELLTRLGMEPVPVGLVFEGEDMVMTAAGAPHRPALNCCRTPHAAGPCAGWKKTLPPELDASLHDPALCTCMDGGKNHGMRGPCPGWKGKRQTPSLAPDKGTVKPRASSAGRGKTPAQARERIANAEKMFGSDRSKWTPKQRRDVEALEKVADLPAPRQRGGKEGGNSGEVLKNMSTDDLGAELSRIRETGDIEGTSRDDVRGALASRTVPQLKAIAKKMGLGTAQSKTKKDLVDNIVHGSVGFHENSQRIRGGTWSDRFSDEANASLIVTAGAGLDGVAEPWTITVPALPDPAMFAKDFPQGTPPTLTEDGRFFGYFAPGNTAHRSYARAGVRKTAKQLGRTDYSRWLKRLPAANGETVLAGPVTMGCMHAPTQGYGTLDRRHQYYEDTCSIVAKVTVGEDGDGSRWFAGQLMSGVTAQQVEQLLMCDLSLDSQPHPDRPGWQDFVGILAVPMGGWPISTAGGGPVTRVVEEAGEAIVTASSHPIVFRPAVYISEMAMYALAGVDPAQVLRENVASFHAALKGEVTL